MAINNNRTSQQVEEFVWFINKDWTLSLNEKEFLTEMLTVLQNREESTMDNTLNLVQDNFEEVLDYIGQYRIVDYVENHCNMVDANMENDLVDALDNLNFDWVSKAEESEMIEYLEDNGYRVTEESNLLVANTELDYVDETRVKYIVDSYLSGSWQEKEEIFNKLK